MYQLILVLHVLIAISVIGLVLLQHGKGADIGAGFGSGASNTVFGSQGTGGFLFKLTGGLVMAFFITSLLLSSMVANQYKKSSGDLIEQSVPSQESSQIPIPDSKK
ncbi:MAG: preprotein translocase subunit SecG [Legionellaceae bacterium]|nr:preprotein translocase subunit SecG [Legionellaceae bacterium]